MSREDTSPPASESDICVEVSAQEMSAMCVLDTLLVVTRTMRENHAKLAVLQRTAMDPTTVEIIKAQTQDLLAKLRIEAAFSAGYLAGKCADQMLVQREVDDEEEEDSEEEEEDEEEEENDELDGPSLTSWWRTMLSRLEYDEAASEELVTRVMPILSAQEEDDDEEDEEEEEEEEEAAPCGPHRRACATKRRPSRCFTRTHIHWLEDDAWKQGGEE